MHRASLWVGAVRLRYDIAQQPKRAEVAPPLQMLHQAKTRGALHPHLSSDGSSTSRYAHLMLLVLLLMMMMMMMVMVMVMTSIIIVWASGCNVALCMICYSGKHA